MSLTELETEVQKLSPAELNAFTCWLDEYTASQWDSRIEDDLESGKLAHLFAKADADFDAGACKPL